MGLGAASGRGKARPVGTEVAEADGGRIDQPHRLSGCPPQTGMGLLDHVPEQLAEHLPGPPGIGLGQRRTLHRTKAQMIKPMPLARQAGLDLTQARRAAKLSVEQRQQMAPGVQPTGLGIGAMRGHRFLQTGPWNQFGESVKNSILMGHGVVSFLMSRTFQTAQD